MITCYFGVPRVGKNTFLTKIAQYQLKLISAGKSRYDRIYSDFYCKGCYQFSFSDLDKYKAYHCLFLFGEMGLDADGRLYKNFPQGVRDFLVLHAHVFCDIIYATQDHSNVDKKIRDLTQELWYLEKSSVPFLNRFTTATRIFRTIAINEMTSELINGYRFANVLEKIFTPTRQICYRPRYYKFFESYEEGPLEPRPILPAIPWDNERSVVDNLNQIEKSA